MYVYQVNFDEDNITNGSDNYIWSRIKSSEPAHSWGESLDGFESLHKIITADQQHHWLASI